MHAHRTGEGGGAGAFGHLMQRFGEAADGIGDLRFAYLDDVVEHFAQNRNCLRSRHARGEPVRQARRDRELAHLSRLPGACQRRRRRALHADEARMRRERVVDEAHAGREAASAHRHEERIERLRRLIEHLQGNRCVAGHELRLARRMHGDHAAPARHTRPPPPRRHRNPRPPRAPSRRAR